MVSDAIRLKHDAMDPLTAMGREESIHDGQQLFFCYYPANAFFLSVNVIRVGKNPKKHKHIYMLKAVLKYEWVVDPFSDLISPRTVFASTPLSLVRKLGLLLFIPDAERREPVIRGYPNEGWHLLRIKSGETLEKLWRMLQGPEDDGSSSDIDYGYVITYRSSKKESE